MGAACPADRGAAASPPTELRYVHPNRFPNPEANTKAVAAMCGAFARQGLATSLYGVSDQGEDALRRHYPGCEGVRFRMVSAEAIPSQLAAAALADATPGTLIYTRSPQVAALSAFRGAPTALELHSPPSQARAKVYLALQAASLLPSLRLVVSINPVLSVRIRKELPLYRGPVHLAPSASDDLRLGPAPTGFTHDVGYVGSANPGKGVEFIAALAERLPALRFLAVCDLAAAGPAVRGRLASLANLELVEGVSPGRIGEQLARFPVAVAPYGRQVFGARNGRVDLARWMSPVKLVEYMSAGKAIVTSDTVAGGGLIDDGRNGLVLEPDNLEQWAGTLERLKGAPGLVRTLGEAARADWEAGLSWDARAAGIVAALGLKDASAPQRASFRQR